MNRNFLSVLSRVILAVFTIAVLPVPGAQGAAKEKVIHRFNNLSDGSNPDGSLIFDSAGNLYGGTSGDFGVLSASVFELTPTSAGKWKEKILYLVPECAGGIYNGLIFDLAGDLVGPNGGGCYGGFAGYVFELHPSSGGKWKEHTIDAFHGWAPAGPFVMDANGDLYGTIGGDVNSGGNGSVFELTPKSGGGWQETVLYHFKDRKDGSNPNGGLVFDKDGNLYGTTYLGGSSDNGTVYKLTHKSGGEWTHTVLHNFTGGRDGLEPSAGVILNPAGNLYGTTLGGGADGFGTVFHLTLTSGGKWKETVLHSFASGDDGAGPMASLVFDPSGNLYGTTAYGGLKGTFCLGSCGTVFKLTPASNGKWTENIVYLFRGGDDGAAPSASVTLDSAGNIYGTTNSGGGSWDGTVFEIAP